MAKALPASLRPKTSSPDNPRKRKMRAVLAACRRLGIDQDTRKDVQMEIVGKTSMSLMNLAELGKLLDHFNRNWNGKNPARPHLAKIRALWWTLYWLGEIKSPGERALSGFVKRQTGITALRFVDHTCAPPVIEALKSWIARVGVIWIEGGCDRRSVIICLQRKLLDAGIYFGDNELVAAGLPVDPKSWTDQQADDVIRLLGKAYRGYLEYHSGDKTGGGNDA